MTAVHLHSGWLAQVSALAAGSGVLANPNALVLLLGGILLSLLLGVLVYVLATGRTRALVTVHEQTDELRYQAMHDSLTGLPNRALVLDRLAQMLARSRLCSSISTTSRTSTTPWATPPGTSCWLP
jgi:predicted signal transduction protein with EAL and GGDEF domain